MYAIVLVVAFIASIGAATSHWKGWLALAFVFLVLALMTGGS